MWQAIGIAAIFVTAYALFTVLRLAALKYGFGADIAHYFAGLASRTGSEVDDINVSRAQVLRRLWDYRSLISPFGRDFAGALLVAGAARWSRLRCWSNWATETPMSSSISSSEALAAQSESSAWGRWLATFIGVLVLGAALVYGLVLIVDPYDSGRAGLLGIKGVDDASPRTANASRARDQDFDSAIIGNSTGQMVKPAELSRLTGLRFVQLTVPGTGPREQLAVMDFFLRKHAKVGALVIVTDESWCSRDPALPQQHPFPYWLYGESDIDFLGRLFSSRALSLTWRRILIGLGLRQRSAPDGYWDYEALGPREFQPLIVPRDDGGPAPGQVSEDFPGLALLAAAIRKLPSDLPVVLFTPPAYHTMLPRPGSRDAAEEQACAAALRKVVAGRSHSNFIDYRVDNALTRDRANFMDFGHYRAPIARRIEQGIAESIRVGESAKIEF